MSAENWHEERDRLRELLEGIESGIVTHIDEKDLRQLQPTNPGNIALLKERLTQLNTRLGEDNAHGKWDAKTTPPTAGQQGPDGCTHEGDL